MKRSLTLLVLGMTAVLTVACDGSDAGVRTGGDDGASESTTGAAPAGSPSKEPTSADECLAGSFLVTRFVGKESVSTPAGASKLEGSGGGLRMTFGDGTWTMTGDGSRPINGRVGSYPGTITVNGTSEGRYASSGSGYVFEQQRASGSVTLSALGEQARLPMSTVGPALAPNGTATVSCSGDQATLESASVTLTMRREQTGGSDTGGGSTGSTGSGGGTKIFDESGQTIVWDCNGGVVVLNGSDDVVTLRGTCPNVTINGSSNKVTIDRVNSIQVNGDSNTVRWRTGAEPRVVTLGSGNSVGRA